MCVSVCVHVTTMMCVRAHVCVVYIIIIIIIETEG